MFTQQVGGLSEAQSLEQLKETLLYMLGNCQASLLHNGQLNLLGSRDAGASDAVLDLANYPIAPADQYTLPDANGEMGNGWALRVRGPTKFIGPVVGGFGFGKASGDWVASGSGAWESYVDATIATGAAGTAAQPLRTVRIYLPRTSTRDPNVRTDDIIMYQLAADGRAYCTSEVYDGKIGEIRDIGLGEDPTTYATGKRGWWIADGNNDTNNIAGDNSYLVGWTGVPPYDDDIGNAVAGTFTAAITGNGGTTTTSSTGVTITGSTAATTHNHTVELTSASVDSTGSSPVTVVATVAGLSFGVTAVDDESSHVHGVGSLAGSSHTHTVSNDTLAGALTIGTPSANRPAGRLVVRVQRVS